ncbi:MAG: DUF116 domain-containing protein [Peptococcaceae bacterium]|jgi:hypothetical protein|nr:DUF116 domain-containing protein [Peptococcaceae bacterium]MDH7524291.1 DUF116 domain-containing protein [Peptococcaceae bacterium]
MRKRLFIGLLVISLFFLLLLFAGAWWLVSYRGLVINKIILTFITAAVVFLLFMLVTGLAAMVWSLWRARTIPLLHNIMLSATNMLFPLAIAIGKGLGLSEDRVKNSFINVSNHLVRGRDYARPFKNIIILAPHCLQWVYCPHKITIDVHNCRECGRCPVSTLLKIARRYDVQLRVVTGGTFARKVVRDVKPEAIVAIACERDLTSGIQDIAGLPVIGIVNERPEGPCFNTKVDYGKVEEAIQFFLKGGLR